MGSEGRRISRFRVGEYGEIGYDRSLPYAFSPGEGLPPGLAGGMVIWRSPVLGQPRGFFCPFPRRRSDRTGRASALFLSSLLSAREDSVSKVMPLTGSILPGTLFFPPPFPDCELCGRGEGVIGHHKNLNHADNREENRQRLCRKCHEELHNAIGRVRRLFRRSYRISKQAGRAY